MLEQDVRRLTEPYPITMTPEGLDLARISDPLGLALAEPIALGNEIADDLDGTVCGIGWWRAYPGLDRQTRILLSDYLVACARAVPDNLVEAQVNRLEFDHAVEDFRQWMSRGVRDSQRWTVEAPRSPYEELSTRRARGHLADLLRAWGSALDCIGGCIVGVAGLPTNLVRADMDTAWKSLIRHSSGNQLLGQLQADLGQAEANAGPAGWRDWLLGMRNTVVHRGRRTMTWADNLDGAGVKDFNLRLPVAPSLTEVDAVIQAGGVIAATFEAAAAEFLDELGKTVDAFVSDACRLLADLWRKRRADPRLLSQSPDQWRQPPGLITPPAFRGFPHLTSSPSVITSFGVDPEGERRLRAAGLTRLDVGEIRPDPLVWT